MTVKVLTDKAGALQGLDVDGVARQAYGGSVHFMADPTGEVWPGYIGAMVRHSPGRPRDEYEVVDYVLDIHEVSI